MFARAAGKLKIAKRTGWANRFLPSESVADHSYRTALLAAVIADYAGLRCDMNKTLKMALIHDLGESFLGDWDLDSTRLYGVSQKHRLEVRAMDHLCSLLPEPLGTTYFDLWREFNQGSCLESQVVHLADKLDALIRAREIEDAGLSVGVYAEFKKSVDERRFNQKLRKFYTQLLRVMEQ